MLPTARREYRVALSGRVELLVKQFDRVEPGTPLFRLDSAEWHKVRLSLEEDHAAVEKAQTDLLNLDADDGYIYAQVRI